MKKNISSKGSEMLEQAAWETVKSLHLGLLRKQMYKCSKKQTQPAPGRCWRTFWGLFQPHPPCDPHRQKQIICLSDDPGSPAHQHTLPRR